MRKRLAASLAAVAVLFLWTPYRSPAAEPGTAFTRIGDVEVLGNGAHHFDVGVGVFDVRNKADKITAAGRVELRIGKKLYFVGPAIGLMLNARGGLYGYAGIYADFAYKKFILTPVLSIGGYRKGDSLDMGGVFGFRESLGIAYPLDNRSRIGIGISHVSNADIYKSNPGEEEILVTYAVGF